MAPVRVHRNDDLLLWEVSYTCCPTHTMRFHDWGLALRIALGHRCPEPARPVQFPRRKRLTRTVR